MPGLADFFRAAIGSSKTDTFDALRSAAAIADTFDAFSDDAAQAMLLDVLLPWAALVARMAVHKWGTHQRICKFELNGAQCRTKPIGQCYACGRPICLAHAFVGSDATLVCWSCMKQGAANAKPWASTKPWGPDSNDHFEGAGWTPPHEPEPDKPDRIRWAYAVLGVEPDAADDKIRTAYKKACRQHHPDRANGPDDAKIRTEKLKMINVAKQIIWRQRSL